MRLISIFTIFLSVCLLVSPVLAFEFNPLDNFELEVCDLKEGLIFIVEPINGDMSVDEIACHVFVQAVAVGSICYGMSVIGTGVERELEIHFDRLQKETDTGPLREERDTGPLREERDIGSLLASVTIDSEDESTYKSFHLADYGL